MNEQVFDQIVSGFYKAATGGCGWDEALLPLQRAFQARAALLHSFAAADGRLLALDAAGPNLQDAVFDYVSEYHQHDPRKQLVVRLGASVAGRLFTCDEHFDEGFAERDHFFRNFLAAYETRYNASVLANINDQVTVGLALELPRARGPLNPDERAWILRIAGHLHDALRAYERIRRLMQQALAGHQLLAGYPYPMWLLDTQRGITFENPAALRERERGERVAATGGRLVLIPHGADKRLAESLQGLQRAGHGASASVDIRPTEADAPCWLHLSMLVPMATLGAFGERPMVLATLFDPLQVSALDTFALAKMFKLTPAEAKIAARLADGLTAEQIAAAFHISQNTVRFHIRQVLAKLGASRVVDVVRMLRQGEALWAGRA